MKCLQKLFVRHEKKEAFVANAKHIFEKCQNAIHYSDPIMIIPAQKLKFGHFQNTNFGLSDLTKSKL